MKVMTVPLPLALLPQGEKGGSRVAYATFTVRLTDGRASTAGLLAKAKELAMTLARASSAVMMRERRTAAHVQGDTKSRRELARCNPNHCVRRAIRP
jgi:hypothetical protein